MQVPILMLKGKLLFNPLPVMRLPVRLTLTGLALIIASPAGCERTVVFQFEFELNPARLVSRLIMPLNTS